MKHIASVSKAMPARAEEDPLFGVFSLPGIFNFNAWGDWALWLANTISNAIGTALTGTGWIVAPGKSGQYI